MKKVIIVGASSGIGKAVAGMLDANEYRIYNISRTPCDVVGVCNMLADVEKVGATKKVIEKIIKAEGSIDLAIYCAGQGMIAPVELCGVDEYKQIFDVNFFGAIRFLKSIIPAMRQNGGKVVVVSSLAGTLALPYQSAYCASKAALSSFSQVVAGELGLQGISLTCVCPGGTATGFSRKRKTVDVAGTVYEENYKNAHKNITEFEQEGMSAEDVAKAVLLLVNRKNPPSVYTIGTANKLVSAVSGILPKGVVGKMVDLAFEV